jgi:hypothetical protein
MSVQTNQYLFYGVMKPFEYVKQWEKDNNKDFYDTFEGFMDDSAFKKTVTHNDGIFCLFDGMNGKYIIIGRVLEKGSDDEPFIANGKPMSFDTFPEVEHFAIFESIEKNFGISDEPLKYWLITNYR